MPAGLEYIEVRDYKPFRGESKADLAPLTVVFGPNGSGKSALIRLPVLLSAALRPTSDAGPGLPFVSRGIHFGSSLLDFCHGGTPTGFDVAVGFGASRLHVSIGKAPGGQAHVPDQRVESWTWTSGGRETSVRWDGKSRRYQSAAGNVTGFRGLVPVVPLPESRSAFDVGDLAPLVEHLGSRRDVGDTRFVAVGPRPVWDVGPDGADTAKVLASLAAFDRGGVLDQIKAAVAVVLGMELDLQEVQAGGTAGYSIAARRSGRATWRPLQELGTGLAHALPVIVQQCAATAVGPGDRPPGILVVEEPESHLHPAAQAELADVLLATGRTGRCQCLVETHSETLILRLQRRVAEEPSLADSVSLIYIDDEGAATRPRALRVSPNGEVPDWPEGWFDAALREAQAMHAARRATLAP